MCLYYSLLSAIHLTPKLELKNCIMFNCTFNLFISESALINVETEQHPLDHEIWNSPKGSHDLVSMIRVCTDWPRAESWAGL